MIECKFFLMSGHETETDTLIAVRYGASGSDQVFEYASEHDETWGLLRAGCISQFDSCEPRRSAAMAVAAKHGFPNVWRMDQLNSWEKCVVMSFDDDTLFSLDDELERVEEWKNITPALIKNDRAGVEDALEMAAEIVPLAEAWIAAHSARIDAIEIGGEVLFRKGMASLLQVAFDHLESLAQKAAATIRGERP